MVEPTELAGKLDGKAGRMRGESKKRTQEEQSCHQLKWGKTVGGTGLGRVRGLLSLRCPLNISD